jgi:hypothetical protein
MNLDEFLSKNKVELSQAVYNFCNEGISRLQNARDPLHDEKHSFRILSNLDEFLKNEDVKDKVDLESLITAIIWHDVWRSRVFVNNPFSLFYGILGDGIFGMFVFRKASKKAVLDPETIKKVAKIILYHPDSGPYKLFRKRRILETKILLDLDTLDMWSSERTDSIIKSIDPDKASVFLIRLAKFFLDKFMFNQNTETNFHFEWSKQEFKKRREQYIIKLNKLIDKYNEKFNLSLKHYRI